MTELELYETMCAGCPNESRCHEECEVCDEFIDAMLEKEGEKAWENSARYAG